MLNPTFRPQRTFQVIHSDEILQSGHFACPGCGIMPMIRQLLKIYGKKTIIVTPACCYAVVDGPFPYSSAGLPLLHTAFEAAAAYASGVRAALDMKNQTDIQVVVIAGDGGTFDIGIQALSAAAERNENFLYICYDNEAYMNTGIQRSSATPLLAWTTTTPYRTPKREPKKDLGAIMAAHRIPYFATASLGFPEDLDYKLQKARDTQGFRMIHYYSSCPTGWKLDSRYMVTLARLAVQTRIFPLYEVEHGEIYRVTVDPDPIPLKEYLSLQGRFKHLTENDIRFLEQEVQYQWKRLKQLESLSSHPATPEAVPV